MNIVTLSPYPIERSNVTTKKAADLSKWIEKSLGTIEKKQTNEIQARVEEIVRSRLGVIRTSVPTPYVAPPVQINPVIPQNENNAPIRHEESHTPQTVSQTTLRLEALKKDLNTWTTNRNTAVEELELDKESLNTVRQRRSSAVFLSDSSNKELCERIVEQTERLKTAKEELRNQTFTNSYNPTQHQTLSNALARQKKNYHEAIRSKKRELKQEFRETLNRAVEVKFELANKEAECDFLTSKLASENAMKEELSGGLKIIATEKSIVTKKNSAYSTQIEKYENHIEQIQQWNTDINTETRNFHTELESTLNSAKETVRNHVREHDEEVKRKAEDKAKAKKNTSTKKPKVDQNSRSNTVHITPTQPTQSAEESKQKEVDKLFFSDKTYKIYTTYSNNDEYLYSPSPERTDLKVNPNNSESDKFCMSYTEEVGNGYWKLHHQSGDTYHIQNTSDNYYLKAISDCDFVRTTRSGSPTSWEISGGGGSNRFYIKSGGKFLGNYARRGIPKYHGRGTFRDLGYGPNVITSNPGISIGRDDKDRRPVILSQTSQSWLIIQNG